MTDISEEDRLARLPRWARKRIEALGAEVAALQAELAATRLETGNLGSPVEIVRSTRKENIPLDPHSAIRFSTGPLDLHDFIDVRLARLHGKSSPVVEVMSGGGLDVLPWATNHIYLATRDR